jgi:hypothetical protein
MHYKINLYRIVFGITFLALLTMQMGCHNFYRISKTPVTTASKDIEKLKLQNRYFILRSGPTAWYMNVISVSEDQKSLQCTLDSLPPEHKLHLKNGRNGEFRYKDKIPENSVLNEVHFYIPADKTILPGSVYTLSLDKVQKIEVLEFNKGRTNGSYAIGALGYTLGAFMVAAIIIAATKSSCPFVSAYDGNEFSLQGEIYGGAIYPQLCRNDYIKLKMAPDAGGSLQLKISNELKERQYTDIAELMVVTHDKDSKILSDEQGNVYSIEKPESPVAAIFSNNKNVLEPLLNAGDNQLLHFDDTLPTNASNQVIVKFNKPENTKKAKLILSLKNSYWLDYLYGKMAEGFGNYYNTFIKQQYTKPVTELNKWTLEQQLPLEVSVKTTTGWQKITDLTTIGPLITREIVVPLAMEAVSGPFTEIKLSSGFMFWEIDYAAIDYSENKSFSVQQLLPAAAVDETGKNVLDKLVSADGKYLEQPLPGTVTTITYHSKPVPEGKIQTYILHTKGYYEHVRNFEGGPKVAFLEQFKKPNGFPKFSIEMYKKVQRTNLESLVLK